MTGFESFAGSQTQNSSPRSGKNCRIPDFPNLPRTNRPESHNMWFATEFWPRSVDFALDGLIPQRLACESVAALVRLRIVQYGRLKSMYL